MWDYNMSNNLINKLCLTWDIHKPYWYPLYSCGRKDVISFNSDNIQLLLIKNILKEKGISEIYEYREDGMFTSMKDITNYMFWDSDDYFWNNECFWFDSSLNWIIYKSHEGTTTFGGLWLLNEIKREMNNWKDYLKWDKNNK